MSQLEIKSRSRTQLLDVTERIQRAVSNSGVREGICYLFVPHTTAGLLINENYDPTVVEDIMALLERLSPRDGRYRHTEGNADAHLKVSLLSNSAFIPVQAGKLALGTWQGIFLCEFDGPRQRRLVVGVIGE
ncbi:MAG: YjbQ family protein [Chloroflexi bacterium]|nr:YjbQ family protein [Chloroflexota bacterium]